MGPRRALRQRARIVRAVKWIVAVLLGATVPAALVTFALDSAGFFPPAVALTLSHAVILGLPLALLYRRLQWRSLAFALAGGFLVGVLPIGVYLWPLDASIGGNAWTGATQTLLNGVPTWAGWIEYLQILGGFGCLGALGAVAFWATLKVTGELRLSSSWAGRARARRRSTGSAAR